MFARKSSASVATVTTANSEAWRAKGFLNMHLLSTKGKKCPFGSLALSPSKAAEQSVLDWIEGRPDRVAKIALSFEIEFNLAGGDANEFDMASVDGTAYQGATGPIAVKAGSADAYLNFWLPADNGGRNKVGFVGLSLDNSTHKWIIDRFTARPEDIVNFAATVFTGYEPNIKSGSKSASIFKE